MKKRTRTLIAVALACTLSWSCASTAPPAATQASQPEPASGRGTVEDIELQPPARLGPSGSGALLGALAGGVLGHQLGSGNGAAVGTLAGVVGGALAGNAVERSANADRYRITVRLDNGARMAVSQAGEGLRAGDRVRVVDGRLERE